MSWHSTSKCLGNAQVCKATYTNLVGEMLTWSGGSLAGLFKHLGLHPGYYGNEYIPVL